jgi:hypothetical protein
MKGSGFEIEVDAGRDIVTMRYIGPLTLAVAERAVDAAFQRPDVSPATAVLLDTTRAQVHEIDVDWFRRYQAFKDNRGYPSQITALGVSRDEGHQLLGKLWAAIRAKAGGDAPGVFTDETAAIEWLQANRSAPHAMTASA